MKLLFFIVNSRAGNGTSQKIWDDVEQVLTNEKIPYKVYFTQYPKHATEIAKEICLSYKDNIEAIIPVGGDGTVNEVMNGITNHEQFKIGYIPAGSGNDFSRGFSLPKKPDEAIRFIIENRHKDVKMFDLGKFRTKNDENDRYFVSSLGAGFDAAVSMQTNKSILKKLLNKIHLGSLAYVGVLIRLLFTYKRTDLTVLLDQKKYSLQNVWFITVSNQAYYGGGMKIAPEAHTADGKFNVTVVHNLSRIKLLFVFGSVFFGTHTRFKEVKQYTCSEISIDSSSKIFVHADGETMGNTPLYASIEHKKLPIMSKDE